MPLVTIYQLSLPENQFIPFWEIAPGQVYVSQGVHRKAFAELSLLLTHKISPPRNNLGAKIYYHQNFFCQTDLDWLNAESTTDLTVAQWLDLERENHLPQISLGKQELVRGLGLYSHQHNLPRHLPDELRRNFALASFLCQSQGLGLVGELHTYAWPEPVKPYWNLFLEKTPLALLLRGRGLISDKKVLQNLSLA